MFDADHEIEARENHVDGQEARRHNKKERGQVVSISMRYGLVSRHRNPVRFTLKEPSC